LISIVVPNNTDRRGADSKPAYGEEKVIGIALIMSITGLYAPFWLVMRLGFQVAKTISN